MSSKTSQAIDITTLNIQQLNALSQQLEEEMEFLSNSLSSLKVAQSKYAESKECLGKVSAESCGKDVLVPLTSSMYVPGQLTDVSTVMVDIGTGYYVEKPTKEAENYFSRKMEYITKQIEKVQPIIQEKFKMKQATLEILQLKVAAQIQSQQQPGAKA